MIDQGIEEKETKEKGIFMKGVIKLEEGMVEDNSSDADGVRHHQ